MEYRLRLSFLLLPAVSWASVISTPRSPDRSPESNEIKQTNSISSSTCTSNCNPPSTSSSQVLELREYSEYHTHSFHHAKYDAHDSPSGPHIPTSWKVAIGVNAFVLVITASILGMLVWILRKEYRKRKLLQGDPTYVGAKDGFGRRMKSARSSRGAGNGRGGRARAWSYDPIREEEEDGEGIGEGVRLGGLGVQGVEGGMSMPLRMNDSLVVPGTEKETLEGADADAKGKGREGTKAKRVWRGKHVRFSSWGGEIEPTDSMGIVAGSSGKENGLVALRTETHEYVQTP
ncbi:e011cd02-1812-4e99-b091-a4e1cba32ba0 [Sclerotinia trifoliorum]|uniref:E011cd02-1812-4e99-b091-a4e1cba32ba0 n=1 Tax=Sclerotinia trifoliorum TaxID=28548 RepID=A0A8H2ZUH0_9HELO|nr:e011cd02-1812-4e99-b091-a4e1cba32ba0 [Sclerotinia trifoliorum]